MNDEITKRIQKLQAERTELIHSLKEIVKIEEGNLKHQKRITQLTREWIKEMKAFIERLESDKP
jgi:uncharacterized coiled-coil DUF342 family protein